MSLSNSLPPPPSRRALREVLQPYTCKTVSLPLFWLVFDYFLFFTGIVLALLQNSILIQTIFSCLIALQMARLFIIGHDACHQSLTPSRSLNRVVGRIAFLPTLTPYSLWEIGHNLAHHGYSNLKGKDSVWVPFSPTEYLSLSPSRRLMERIYRSGLGHGLYYLIELWWKKLYFPSAKEVGGQRSIFIKDGWLVTLFFSAWMAFIYFISFDNDKSFLISLFFGFALPFFLWNTLMGFVIFVHHTDPEVKWYEDTQEWASKTPYLTSTVHMKIPVLGALLHNIMEHPAHHLDMSIPFYQLQKAQNKLLAVAGPWMVTKNLTWKSYWNCVKRCKTFDYSNSRWCDFPAKD